MTVANHDYQHPLLTKDDYARKHPVACALRNAGFVPLPRLWVREADMATVYALTEQYRGDVTRIRVAVYEQAKARGEVSEAEDGVPCSDPKIDREAAWAAFERTRQS